MRYLIILFLIISCNSIPIDNSLNLLPSVQVLSSSNEFSNLNPKNVLTAYSNSNDELPIRYGDIEQIKLSDSNKSIIDFGIDKQMDLKKEGYTLKINNKKITIRAKDSAGLFYAFITLDQIIEDSKNNQTTLPMVDIKDFPSLEFRPIHIDIKHHTEKKTYYFNLIDQLAKLKVNGIIVEFEDKLKYETRPEVGSTDSFSIDWWANLSEYARSRNIMINPLVQGLGHASFILKHEKNFSLRDDPKSDWAFNPLNPKTYELQFDLYLDAIKATPHGKYLHVGGDEVHLTKRDNKSELELNLIWLNKVCAFAKKYNRIPIFWDDMPLKHAGFWSSIFDDNILA